MKVIVLFDIADESILQVPLISIETRDLVEKIITARNQSGTKNLRNAKKTKQV